MALSILPGASLGLLLVLGDSISAGVGASSVSLGYARLLYAGDAERWPGEGGANLRALYGAGLPMVNLARSGATSAQALAALRAHLKRPDSAVTAPIAVVMTLGGNDFKNGVWRELMSGDTAQLARASQTALRETLRNLETLVKLLRAHYTGGCHIYLANVYDASDGQEQVLTPYGVLHVGGLSAALQAWDDAYLELAKRMEITLVDAHQAFLHHGIQAVPPADVSFYDPIHPNDVGHHQLKTLFWRAMTGT